MELKQITVPLLIVLVLVGSVVIYFEYSTSQTLSRLSDDVHSLITKELPWNERMIDQAKSEGRLVVYSAYIAPTTDRLVRAFQRLYPFLDVEYYGFNAVKVIERFNDELAKGLPQADVVMLGTGNALGEWGGNLSQYFKEPESERLKYHPDVIENLWFATSGITLGIAVSTRVAEEIQPDSWEALATLDSAYDGKVLVGDPRAMGTGWVDLYCLYQLLGENKTGEIFTRLKQLNARLFTASTSAIEEVVAGGSDIVCLAAHGGAWVKPMVEGRGIKYYQPEEGFFFYSEGAAISKTAPHSAAAQLWADWILDPNSEFAQIISNEGYVVPHNPDLAPPGHPSPITLATVDYSKVADTEFKNKLIDLFESWIE